MEENPPHPVVKVYHTYLEKMLLISKVLKDRCLHLLWNFDLFEQVDRVYPESSYYKNWFDILEDPDHIIDNIWIGSAFNAADDKWLLANNVKIIVNTTKCIRNYFPELFEYYNYPAEDLNDGSLKDFFIDFYNTVENNKNKGILVHCYAGRSRSVSLVMFYIMKKYNMTVNQALEYISSHRTQININVSFIREIELALQDTRVE